MSRYAHRLGNVIRASCPYATTPSNVSSHVGRIEVTGWKPMSRYVPSRQRVYRLTFMRRVYQGCEYECSPTEVSHSPRLAD